VPAATHRHGLIGRAHGRLLFGFEPSIVPAKSDTDDPWSWILASAMPEIPADMSFAEA
jgi:hypothetical protein